MVSYLVLALGLLCVAGAAVGKDSSEDSADSTQQQRRSDVEADGKGIGFTPTKNCNECIGVVVKILRSSESSKNEKYYWNVGRCARFPQNQSKICRDVINFIVEDDAKDVMKSKKYCAMASYCNLKRQNSSSARNLQRTKWQNQYSAGSTTMRPTAKTKANDAQDTERKENLQSSNSASTCQDCEIIVTKIRKLSSNERLHPFMIPYLCEEFRERRKSCCLGIMSRHGKQIMAMALAKKTSHDICSAIKEGDKYPYCKACRDYVYFSNIWSDEDYDWKSSSCSYFKGNKKSPCVQALQEKSGEMTELMHGQKNDHSICRAVQLCPAPVSALLPGFPPSKSRQYFEN